MGKFKHHGLDLVISFQVLIFVAAAMAPLGYWLWQRYEKEEKVKEVKLQKTFKNPIESNIK